MDNDKPIKAPSLTPEQQAIFLALRSRQTPIALMSGFLDGEPVAIICEIHRDGDSYHIVPLYVEVTEAIAKRLRDAYGDTTHENSGGPRGKVN